MALHAEAPSSKVKREQALRNILAARRRQLLGPKVSEAPKNLRPSPRTPRPAIGVSKDPLDMLEAQETRHGVYVTAPIGDQVAIVMDNDEGDTVVFANEDVTGTTLSSTSSSPETIEKSAESADRSTRNSLLLRINETSDKSPKNVSQASSRGQKSAETEARRKNTVAMPESLYNHFRPVESNIPVEDMTQFLYFGQKIQPESHNGSTAANNSILDAAATSASVPIARRRYSMKRFSTTTPIPVPRLEEIVNEEMNIALERSTIERNKIPKTKNVFRSPGSGTYFRKSATKATDQTIVSNVIPTRESARNASAEADAARPSDSSANANQISQVAVIPGDLGIGSFARSAADNASAHRARNTTAASLHSDTETGESDDNTGKSAIDSEQLNSTGKTNDRSKIPVPIDDAVSEASTRAESSTVQFVFTTDYESTDEKSNKITTWQFVHTADEVSTSSPKIGTTDFALTLRKIGNLAGTPDPTVPSSPADATTASLAHSSLRIVVTEPIGYDRRIESATSATWLSADEAAKDSRGVGTANGKAIASSPVNQADSRKDRTRQRIGESARPIDRHLPAGLPSSQAAPTATATGSVNSAGRVHNTSDSPPASGSLNTAPVSTPVASSSTYRSTPPAPLSSHPRQQHAYAYEITNVTRLLRNYTGPGLSGVMDRRAKQEEEEEEEEDGRKKESEDETPSRSEGEADEAKRKNAGKKKPRKSDEEEAAERGNHEERGSALTRPGVPKIRNDGGPTPQSPLPLLLLPTPQSRPDATRSSGGTVEPAARTPGALSAGTDVDGATAGATSGWNAITSTGSAPITRSGGGNSGARASRTGDSSQSPSASSSSSSSASSSSSSSSSTSSSSSSTLVGERGRKGAHGARQQYHQLNQNRGIAAGGRASALSAGSSSSVGTRNVQPSASGTVASVEVSGAVDSLRSVEPKSRRTDEVTENTLVSSTVRWNHTGVKKLGGGERAEGYGYDRRYLRKSVSAVLNQRPIEEGLVKELKRRRESTLQAGGSDSVSSGLLGSLNSRRTKGSRAGEDARSSVLRSMENTTVSARGETTAGQSSGGHEDAIGEEPSEVGEKVTGERSRVTGDPAANVSRTIAPRLVTTEANIETTVDASGVEVGMDLATRASEDKGTSGEVGRGRDQSDERANLTEVTPRDLSGVSDGEGTVANGEGTREASTDSATTSTTSTTSRDASTSAGNTEAPETTTSSATPAFPVTPRMLKELKDEASKGPETGDPPTDSDQAKPEASRPFGLAKDLDPSEIQKMYRSQTTVRPDLPMTTIIPETSTDPSPEDPATRGKGHPGTASPVNSSVTRKPIGGERSPEVRGRNLSDKIKDKDDVLPIMQLYNTSGIFNGTAGDAREAASAVSLPGAIEVNATRQPSDSELTATLVPDASESSTRRAEESPGGAKHQRGNSDDEPAGGTKRNRNQGSREESRDSNGPGRSTNHTGSHNSYGANRTRHRPTYQPPEFIGYRPEFNGSFFEPGMISVSSRESVNVSEVITKRHDGDTIATQETVAVVSYILATLIVFPIAVGVGLILRRLIIRNRKVLEESDTSSEISCRKDALNLENGDFKTSIEKAITKLPRIQHLCHEAEKPPPPPSQESRWEFPRDKLRLQTVLGQGNFGQVWKAEADDLTGHQGTTRLVAVKTVKEGASAREKEDLIRELEIMQQLGNHSNVVTLLGCCTEEEPHYLILEYVMYGKLLAYLRDHRTRQDFYNFSEDSAALTSRDLTVFGYCVARGMEYLASKKIIHRDLAARNVLVDHNKLCKIADFGMSRFANDDGEVIEARHGRNALPIRWMAPESLIYSLFTTKTDVWSFGILMWEIVTLGSTPYPDMAAREVMRNVQNGYRLERPSHCRSELFRVIARCWHADPDRRPEFQVLRRDMAQLLEDSMNGHYVDLESFASECTD